MTLLLPTLRGAVTTSENAGSQNAAIHSATDPGDLILILGLGRSYNLSTPSGYTTLRSASGSSEGSFTHALVCYRVAPDPVPASAYLGAPAWNSSATTASLALPAGVSALTYMASGTAGSGSTIVPGNVTVAEETTILVLCCANTNNNTENVNYTAAGYTTVENSTPDGNRITTAMFSKVVGIGTTALPTISMNMSAYRNYYIVGLTHGPHRYKVVSY